MYVDRPRAQLDYYPTSGSAPMVYALGDFGAQLLTEGGAEFANCEWSRKNREAGRPFIEHQLEIVEFHIALERSTRGRSDVRLIHPEEIIASPPERTRKKRNPFTLRATISQSERAHESVTKPSTHPITVATSTGRPIRFGNAFHTSKSAPMPSLYT
ncbi:replication-relaxation family protein [Bradyrhizobium sp. USDA 329]|uniref:replication-relaxation family protein n=1 Tax=Bradyrhizobium sp. USDA 329 TaxID=3156310 RepID=UPI00351473D6